MAVKLSRTVSIRLSTEQGEVVKRALKSLGVEGERAFKRIEHAASRLKTVKQATRDFSTLRRSILNVKSVMAGLGAGLAMGKAFDVLSGVERSLSAVEAVTKASTAEMESMTDVARQLGATTIFSAGEAAEGMKFLGMAGFETSQILGAMPAVLDIAAAGTLELGEAADIVTNIMTTFGIEAENAGGITDILAASASSANTDIQQLAEAMKYVGPIASTVRMEVKNTAAAIGVLSNSNLKASMAGTGLRQILTELIAPSAKTKKIIKELELEMENLSPEVYTLSEIFRTLEKSGVGNRVFEIFGDRGGSAAAILLKMNQQLSEFETNLGNVDGEAHRMATTMSDNLYGSGKAFLSILQELILRTGDKGLTGTMRGVIDTSTGVLRVWGGMADPLEDSTERFQDLAHSIEGVAAALGALAVASGIAASLTKKVAIAGAVMNPIVLGTLAVAAAIGGVVAYRDELYQMIDPVYRQRLEWEEQERAVARLVERMEPLVHQYDNLASVTDRTTKQELNLRDITQKLIGVYPELSDVLDGTVQSARALNETMRELEVGQQVLHAGQALTKLRNSYGARKLSQNEGDWFLTIYDPDRKDEIIKELDTALKDYQNALNALAMPGAQPSIGSSSLFGPKVPENWDWKSGQIGTPSATATTTSLGGASPYKTFQKGILEREFKFQNELESIGKKGLDARILQQEHETARSLREIGNQIEKAEAAENLHADERVEILKHLWNQLSNAEILGQKKIVDIRNDFYEKARAQADKEAAKQKKQYENRLREYELSYSPSFRRDESMRSLSGFQDDLSSNAYESAQRDIDEQFIQAQRRILMETGTWADGMKVATDDYLDSVSSGAHIFYDVWSNSIRNTEDLLTDFFATGELNFDNFLGSIRGNLARGLSQKVMGSIFGGDNGGDFIGSLFKSAGGLFGGGRATGGSVIAGHVYEINERREREYFKPRVGGEVIPLSRMPQVQNQNTTKSSVMFQPGAIQITYSGDSSRPSVRTRGGASDRQSIRALKQAIQEIN